MGHNTGISGELRTGLVAAVEDCRYRFRHIDTTDNPSDGSIYQMEDPNNAILREIDQLRKVITGEVDIDELPSPFIDWPTLADATYELDWLVEGLWPTGKHLALFAAHKTGKSLLSLHIACSIALGVDAFTGTAITPHDVLYLDKEMSETDIQERMLDMGHYKAMKAGDLKRLHYALHPVIAPMDTPEGGRQLLAYAQNVGATVVIIDTLSRVVQGDENASDTYKAFYANTGWLLKANGIALMRLDHEGHSGGKMRGSSAKGDDIDIAFRLVEIDGGYQFVRNLSRVGYVSATVTVTKGEEPLSFTIPNRGGISFLVGTPEKAKELRDLGVPLGLSVRATQRWLRERGMTPGKTAVLADAIKYRNDREEIDEFVKRDSGDGETPRELP